MFYKIYFKETVKYLYRFYQSRAEGLKGVSLQVVAKSRNSYGKDYRTRSTRSSSYKKSMRGAASRTTEKLRIEIVEAVRATAGEEAVRLVGIMSSEKNLSEFKLVEKMKLDIQRVRNLLYKLHSNNLADYKRVKDNKDGTYVSYWKFNKPVAEKLFARIQQEKLQRFRERLEEEASNINGFFICPAACVRADFTTAVQTGFKCTECGQLLGQEDNTRTIDFLREKVREMEAVA